MQTTILQGLYRGYIGVIRDKGKLETAILLSYMGVTEGQWKREWKLPWFEKTA